MSICTKTGDAGQTGLLYNRRVPKTHARVQACGVVDELNAALGLARATATEGFIGEPLLRIQKELVNVMGEIATLPEDMERFLKDGFQAVVPEMLAPIEGMIKEIEGQKVAFKGWATPGATYHAAALDVARTVCRRAERRVWGLIEAGEVRNMNLPVYFNRLSDLLWLMARWVESRAEELNK